MTLPALLRQLIASPAPDPALVRPRSERLIGLAAAAALGAWVFAYKMICFLGLETTSDLYACVQLSTSWLHGRLLYDNFFGNQLATHTLLIAPLLSVLTWPFGAVGLFVFLGLAAAASFLALLKILRLLGVPGDLGLLSALALMAAPLSAFLYQDVTYGFHFELLEPALALWLAYFLLKRHWPGALALALALILVKEDASLLVLVVAAVIFFEDLIRSRSRIAPSPITAPALDSDAHSRWRQGLNAPAAGVFLLGIVALPLLFLLLHSQQVPGAPTNFDRIHPPGAETGLGHDSLPAYLVSHLGTWLRSPVVLGWLGLALPATFGLVLLRPHFLIFGVLTTFIAWFVQDLLLWSPRLAPALVFFQLIACLAFASLWRVAHELRLTGPRGKLAATAFLALVACGAVFGIRAQLHAVPYATEMYQLAPYMPISVADREKADRLFELYRVESRRDDPVIASDYLFRYAHDRNLLWYSKLKGRPQARWILWDTRNVPLATIDHFLRADAASGLADYQLLAQADRFLLFKLRPKK